jgi:putative transcriptional regulator
MMRSPTGNPLNFTGQLLVAHPSMLDPNFRRSVLFISTHDAKEGAIGVILNRPLHKRVSEIAPDDAPAALAEVPVYLGGPVATNELMFAALDWKNGGALILDQSLALGEASLPSDKRNAVRAFVGYAGWTAGQLERELEQHAWLLQKPDPAALAPERLPKLWFEIMRGLGPWFKLLAAAPDDPSLN